MKGRESKPRRVAARQAKRPTFGTKIKPFVERITGGLCFCLTMLVILSL